MHSTDFKNQFVVRRHIRFAGIVCYRLVEDAERQGCVYEFSSAILSSQR